MSATTRPSHPIIYPESDGKPMAENTLQYRWIVTIVGGLRGLFADRPDVFISGDLLWYPVEGKPQINAAPDAMVAFGRPQGDRRSYLQWEEGGVASQVVFEVRSPSNTDAEMARKRAFYERHGVEEYYCLDPDRNSLAGWLRRGRRLAPIPTMDGWVSPRLGIRFVSGPDEPTIARPDGQPFVSYEALYARGEELAAQATIAQAQATIAQAQATIARTQAELERRERVAAQAQAAEAQAQAAEAQARSERLAAQLRALGIDPATL